MKKFSHKIIATSLLSICFSSVYAADNFGTSIMIQGVNSPFNDSYDSIEALLDAVEQDHLGTLPGYTNTVAATATLNIRGIEAIVGYEQDSANLRFSVPSLGIEENFGNFATREENEDAFEEYLESNVDGILTKMLQKMVATTATDPVAGNPNSLMSTMASADFNAAYDMASGSEKKQNETKTEETRKKLEAGLEVGRFSANGVSKNILTLPVSYTHYFEDPNKRLKLSAPLSYVETNGSKSFKGSFGAALSYPVNEKWAVIPAARVGLLASEDMGSAAVVYSGSLTSLYQFPYKDMSFIIGNMVNVMTTGDIKIEDKELSYDLSNQVIKNGVSIEKPIDYKMLGKLSSVEFSLANTQFFGDDLYIDNYTDLAVSLGTRQRVKGSSETDNSIHVGLTYTVGQHGYSGGKLNFGYKF